MSDETDLINSGNGHDTMPPPDAEESQRASRVPEGETKAEAFVRLAIGRMSNVHHHLGLVANLANTNSYEYTDDQVHKILSELRKWVGMVEAAFEPKVQQDKFSF